MQLARRSLAAVTFEVVHRVDWHGVAPDNHLVSCSIHQRSLPHPTLFCREGDIVAAEGELGHCQPARAAGERISGRNKGACDRVPKISGERAALAA